MRSHQSETTSHSSLKGPPTMPSAHLQTWLERALGTPISRMIPQKIEKFRPRSGISGTRHCLNHPSSAAFDQVGLSSSFLSISLVECALYCVAKSFTSWPISGHEFATTRRVKHTRRPASHWAQPGSPCARRKAKPQLYGQAGKRQKCHVTLGLGKDRPSSRRRSE